jgi:hypothetical protein
MSAPVCEYPDWHETLPMIRNIMGKIETDTLLANRQALLGEVWVVLGYAFWQLGHDAQSMQASFSPGTGFREELTDARAHEELDALAECGDIDPSTMPEGVGMDWHPLIQWLLSLVTR